MSDAIGHECGLILLRLKHPPSYYRDRHGDPGWGIRKLVVLMEKLRNRGQDGAGVASIKFDMPPGEKFLLRVRSDKKTAIERIAGILARDIDRRKPGKLAAMDDRALRTRCEFLGDVYLGHLRYGTHSGSGLSACHPLTRKNTVASRNLAMAGNFNMTNSPELFRQLVEYGLHPTGESDTAVVLERIGYELDREHDRLASSMGPESFRGLRDRPLAEAVSDDLDLVRVLSKASEGWDGGYAFAGLLGNGDAFVCRDPNGIRPAFWLETDEVVVMASERGPIVNLFDVQSADVSEVPAGHVLEIKRDGRVRCEAFTEPRELKRCTFERVYFSRGNDADIYAERKRLGRSLAPRVLEAIDHDVEHAVFSFIPNTAESAYIGLVEEVERQHRSRQAEELWRRIEAGSVSRDDVMSLATGRVRAEKVAHKDQKMRTFITHDAARRDLVMHVYDITRGIVQPEDALVVVDDSIVRGTTLRESIITILSRLNPQRIIICSSCPPIMYPDCYGIDMSQLGRFIAFEAAVTLLEERGEEELLDEIEAKCLEQASLPPERMVNHVGLLYDRFTLEELEGKISQLVRPRHIKWDGPIDVLYQSVGDLRRAMPEHAGDWYFTGEFPTPGGYRVLNRSYLNWRQRVDAGVLTSAAPSDPRGAADPRGAQMTGVPMLGAPLDPRLTCLLEEWRQARGVAEIAEEFQDIAGGTMAYSGPGSWSNQASGLGLRGPVTADELDRLVAFYRDRDAPPTIEVAPYADQTLLTGLLERGFGLKDFELVFATRVVPGEDCRRRMTVALPDAVQVRRHVPGDDAADDDFVRVSMSGFTPEGGESSPADLAVSLRCVRHPRSINVGAWEGDRLVGAGSMELMPDAPDADDRPTPIACFFGVSVLPGFRRRGIQQALIAARLQACADAGCELVCIHSAPGIGTERNAARMGFALTYTKVTLQAAAAGR